MVSRISCGAFVPAWRLAKRIAVLPGVVSARLSDPLPVTYAVTSMLIHAAVL